MTKQGFDHKVFDLLIDQILTQIENEQGMRLQAGEKEQFKQQLAHEILPQLKKPDLRDAQLFFNSLKQYCALHLLSHHPAMIAHGLKSQIEAIKAQLKFILSGAENSKELSHQVRVELGKIMPQLEKAAKEDSSLALLLHQVKELMRQMMVEENRMTPHPEKDVSPNAMEDFERTFIALFHMTPSGTPVAIDSFVYDAAGIVFVGVAMGGNIEDLNSVEEGNEVKTAFNPFKTKPTPYDT